MMKKLFRSCLFSVLLVAALLISVLPGKAFAVTQEEIDALRAERMAIAEEHDEKQAVVDELEAEKASILQRKLAMDARNELARQEIENIEKQIQLYDQMIAEEAIKVEQAKAIEAQQLERYRTHVRAMEENGELSYLALILRVNSLSELLTAFDDANDIMRSDRELYDDYIAARQHTEQVKAEYESNRADLESEQEDLREQKAKLEGEIDEAAKLIADLEADIEGRKEELHDLLLAEIEVAERLERLIAQQEEERRAREQAAHDNGGSNGGGNSGGSGGGNGGGSTGGSGDNGGGSGGGSTGGTVVGTGTWSWPCPSCTYVTSRAGNRFHPIFNEWRYHSGIDIGASHGSSVIASDSGTVIMASVNGGYGNCVMIDHGNGYYTLYGHLSGYAVSDGQAVSKGQVIGYVGDTGWATGPHLHFEIRYGSTCLDPEAVGGWTGLTYAPDAGD